MRIFIVLFIILNSLSIIQADEPKQIVDLSNYKGKIVYLDFWASWCVPCRKSFPWLNELKQKYSDEQLVIVAINLDKDKSLALDFLKNHPAQFNIIYDPDGISAKKYKIKGMPSSIIFDHNGKVLTSHTGFFQKKISRYEKEIATAVNLLPKTK